MFCPDALSCGRRQGEKPKADGDRRLSRETEAGSSWIHATFVTFVDLHIMGRGSHPCAYLS